MILANLTVISVEYHLILGELETKNKQSLLHSMQLKWNCYKNVTGKYLHHIFRNRKNLILDYFSEAKEKHFSLNKK